MGVSLGQKELAPQSPWIDGELYNDGVTRSGNTVSYSLNLRAWVRSVTGYWNYAWYIDISCGDNKVQNVKIKNQIYRNTIIGGVSYWYSSMAGGNFTGSIEVSGNATTIPVTVQFHDSAGNWGNPQTWNVPIPTASAMSNLNTQVKNITENSATIQASVDSSGAYSSISNWKLNFNGEVQSSSSSKLSKSWGLTELDSGSYYPYTVTVTNTAGYSKSSSGTFYTEDSALGYIMQNGQPAQVITGYVITPDGRNRKIQEIKKI